MKINEQAPAEKEIQTSEAVKLNAVDKVKEDIARVRKMVGETDLSDDFVLISKLDPRGIGMCLDKIKKYEDELKEISAGTINPEYVLYEHADVDGKIEAISRKIDLSSELGKILMTKRQISELPDDQKEFVKSYNEGVRILRHIADEQAMGHGEQEMKRFEMIKVDLMIELKQKKIQMRESLRDQKKADDLQDMSAEYEKYSKLREFIAEGHAFPENERRLEIHNAETKKMVPTWYGELNNLYAEFKSAEQRNFPRNPEKRAESVQKNPDQIAEAAQKEETPMAGKSEAPKNEKPDAEALKHVRKSLDIESAAAGSGNTEKPFISPEAIRGYENALQNFSDYIGRLTNTLRNRSEDRLSELIDDNDIARISGAVRRLQEIKLEEPKDFDEIFSAFTEIDRAIESIGTIQSRGTKDDVESLKSVAHGLRMVSEGASDISRQFNMMQTPESLHLSMKVRRLADVAEERQMLMLRRMENISNYLGR